jgi:hypothetical protein
VIALRIRFAALPWWAARAVTGIVVVAVTGAAFATRLAGLHRGLIYPDGYQYLLMARGIAAHLEPTVRLGPGGSLFVPSLDASLKPLFPALVAALSWTGGIRAAADLITVAAGAVTVVLCGLVTWRLTRSAAAGALGALAALLSPALVYWGGFTGPDALAPALALDCALCVLYGRPGLAGVAGALCVMARPEWALVMLPAALAGLAHACTRPGAASALLAGVFTVAGVVGLVRPPLAPPPGGVGLVLVAVAGSTALQLAAVRLSRTRGMATTAAVAAIALVVSSGISGRLTGLVELWSEQWPLLVLAAAGLVAACNAGLARLALPLLTGALVLGAAYGYRNAGSERYFAQLVPAACVAAGLVVAARPRWLAAAAVLCAGMLLIPAHAGLAPDAFATLARSLAAAPAGTLVTAAPDAYGYLLPHRRLAPLARGQRGLIVLDGAQRAYEPGLTARGAVVARFPAPYGFERADGTLDLGSVLLVDGVVVKATAPPGPGRRSP